MKEFANSIKRRPSSIRYSKWSPNESLLDKANNNDKINPARHLCISHLFRARSQIHFILFVFCSNIRYIKKPLGHNAIRWPPLIKVRHPKSNRMYLVPRLEAKACSRFEGSVLRPEMNSPRLDNILISTAPTTHHDQAGKTSPELQVRYELQSSGPTHKVVIEDA